MTRPTRRALIATALLPLVACRGGDRAPARGPDSADPPAASSPGATDTRSSDPRPLRDPVQLSATADVDGKRYAFTGLGECNHTTDASIYEVPAAMWSARFDAGAGDLAYVNLTLWQPKAAPEVQVSLGLTAGGTTHEIATVKGAPPHGTGSGGVEPAGPGGALHVEGTDAEGRRVRLRVDCSRFTEPVAEGG